MKNDKVEISLCMGSSCFARGNNRILEVLEDQVRANAWEDRVSISGARCRDLCGEGPILFVNGVLYKRLDEGALLDLLQSLLGGPAAAAARLSVRRDA